MNLHTEVRHITTMNRLATYLENQEIKSGLAHLRTFILFSANVLTVSIVKFIITLFFDPR